jgi:phosphoribosylanthranilate isomerase
MHLTVKICGLSREESVAAALDAGADMIGFVFFPPSPRFLSPERAGRIAARAHGRAEIVALSVDMDDSGIEAIVAALDPDWLQLHGNESPERVAAVKDRFGRNVIKAIGVREAADLTAAKDYVDIADRLLLDAKPPKGAVLPGGNGAAFDWRLLENFDPGVSWMLSGGLDAGNVREALAITAAPGVDVSSGVETAPGVKSPDLIRAFIAAARRAAIQAHRPETVTP